MSKCDGVTTVTGVQEYEASDNTDQKRFADGKFGPGNSGRPRGSRNKTTLAAEALFEGEAEALSRKAIELALEGDATALRLCLERILPARKGRPVRFNLPDEEDGQLSTSTVFTELLKAMSVGEVSPEEIRPIAHILEVRRKAFETEELEQRITLIEQSVKGETR